jgi:site-specific DNA-methyltransferase (adenine-specific)
MIEITNEDNMELMARYPDKHFDLAIVDPPYGIGINKDGVLHHNSKYSKGFKTNKKYKPTEWDNEIPTVNYFNELQRVSENQIIWGGNYFLDILGRTKGFVIWYKKGQDKNPNFSPMEFAWSSFESLPKYYDIPWLGFGYINSGETKIHPTQKPVTLYENLLFDFAKPGYKIIDTHGGSLSIAIAIHNCNEREQMNLSLTACELDEEYYEAAMQRLQRHTQQTTIFTQ